jgi:hypothetical protein
MRTRNLHRFPDLLIGLIQWAIILGVLGLVIGSILFYPIQKGVRVEEVGAFIGMLEASNGKCTITARPNGGGTARTFTKHISFCRKFKPGPGLLVEEIRYSKTLLKGMTESRGLNFSIRQ